MWNTVGCPSHVFPGGSLPESDLLSCPRQISHLSQNHWEFNQGSGITQSIEGGRALRRGWPASREKRKQHNLNYKPWLSLPECPAFASCDRKSSVSELFVITQSFLSLRTGVSAKASSISSLLDNTESSNRRILTIISCEAVDRGPVSLRGLFIWSPLFVCPEGKVWACFLRGWYTY